MRSANETNAEVCARKVAYPTWADAEADASRIVQGTTPGLGGMMAPYQCGDHWHNGHMPWKAIRRASSEFGPGLRRGYAGAIAVRHPLGRIDA